MTNFTPLQIQIHIEWTYSFVSYDNTPDNIEFKKDNVKAYLYRYCKRVDVYVINL